MLCSVGQPGDPRKVRWVSLACFIAAGLGRGVRRGQPRRARIAPLAALTLVLMAAAPAAAQAEPREQPEFSCTAVVFRYSGFPNLPGNTVKEKVRVDSTKYFATYTFDGPEASHRFPVIVPPGHHHMDAYAKWNTNGVQGGSDRPLPGGINCSANPHFTIKKMQEVVGEACAGSGFTASPLSAALGQSGRYQIIVSNAGNVPLTFSSLEDPRCDAGTITGGPGEAPVGIGESAAYFCEHVVGLGDLGAPTYTNKVSVTATSPGTEPEGESAMV